MRESRFIMVDIRIQGNPKNLEKLLADIKKNYEVLNISKPYPMRGEIQS